MEKSKKLNDFEQEYFSEISKYSVSENDLLSVKISKKVLAYEVYLRKTFGDSFARGDSSDDYDVKSKRKVEKVTKDKLDNSELLNIMNDIDSSEFDDNLDAIIHSHKQEE